MGMAEHPEQDRALVRLVIRCVVGVLGDDLVGIVTQPELEESAAKMLAVFRATDLDAVPLQDLVQRGADRSTLM